jgi:Concanavalin A-like lectin/glucanases superfamily
MTRAVPASSTTRDGDCLMSTVFSRTHRLRAIGTRLAQHLLPGLAARTSAAARVVACALASLLAVCASMLPPPVPVAFAAPTAPLVYWANFNAAGVAPYLALTQPGASASAGDASLSGVANVSVEDATPSIQITLSFASSLMPTGGSMQCRAATANGPVSRSRLLPPPLGNTIYDVWYPEDQAVLVALRQGACYIVLTESTYPNGAAAGQIVKFDPQTQAFIDNGGDQLAAWWGLDEGSGTTLGHTVIGAQPGTLVGGATWTAGPKSSAERWGATGQSYAWQAGNPTWPCCLGNGPYAITPSAVSFTGSGTAQLPVTSLNPPAANQAQSLAFWLQVPWTPAIPRMALALTSPSVASGIKIGFLNGQFGAWRFGGGQLVAVAPPTPSVWHHVVYTFDGGSQHCLVVDETSTCASATPQTAVPTSFTVGSTAGRSEFLLGSVADVRLYRRVIPPSLIATLQRHGPGASNSCGGGCNV